MSEASIKSLDEIAEELYTKTNKINLMYAFNATGKTRLSVKFKELVNQGENVAIGNEDTEENKLKILYFNAFTEDLFSWDNENNVLKITTGGVFTDLVQHQGKDTEIKDRFKKYISASYDETVKIEPNIDISAGEVRFDLVTGDEKTASNIKISKGEESIFIWSIFYTLMNTIIDEKNMAEVVDRSTDLYNALQYIFIDDPISSLDDNHAIAVAVDLMHLLNTSKYSNRPGELRFMISTHHPLFFNVLYNEYRRPNHCYVLKRLSTTQYQLIEQKDSPFGYHLLVAQTLQKAINNLSTNDKSVKRYHFALFRSLLEKTSTYLGYGEWADCIKEMYPEASSGELKEYERRINKYTHDRHSELEAKDILTSEKNLFKIMFQRFLDTFKMKVSD